MGEAVAAGRIMLVRWPQREMSPRCSPCDSRFMVTQPTGTVTLLFTDVERSTLLLERLGAERYAEALAVHRRVLREAFARHGGHEVDEEGDAFLVAFPAAGEAGAAAVDGQEALVELV